MQAHLEPIADPRMLRDVCSRLRNHAMIAFDTEFMRERTFYPHIALIQIATKDEAWTVDVLALDKDDLAPLFEVFRDPNILKIMHAAQGDQECLYTEYGFTASPSLDTLEAASLLGLGNSIGLAALLKQELGKALHKGHTRTNWMMRPLPEALRKYALEDVMYLVPLAEKLLHQLDTLGRRQKTMEHSAWWEDAARYESRPEEIAERLARSGKVDRRGYAALRELVVWREKRVRELDIPRRRLAEDRVLVDLVRARPQTLEQLLSFRGIHGGELKRNYKQILAAINQSQELPEDQLPELPLRKAAGRKDARAADLLSCAIRLLAERHRISPQHLMPAEKIALLSAKRFRSLQEIIDAELISPDTADLIGETLWKVYTGELAIGLRKGKADFMGIKD